MATTALTAPAAPTLDSVGITVGVLGTGGTPAGMTVAATGSGNGKYFANYGGKTLLLVYNKHATLAKTVTPLVVPTPGGATVTPATRSIPSGGMQSLAFDSDYEDSSGNVTVEAESTDIYMLAVIPLKLY